MRYILSNVARSVVLLLFVLMSGNALAEQPDYTKVYYPLINKAELSILKKDYERAMALYKEAFATVSAPLARDYYNAAVCAVLLKDKKEIRNYLEKLASKGVSLAYLQRQPLFDSLETTKHWRKFKKKYPKYREEYTSRTNQDLRADLDELYARDQYFRQAKGGIRVYGDTLRKIEAANTKRLLKWVEKYGYPGEDLIGAGDSLEQLPKFSIVIQRQTKARNGHDFSGLLAEAVKQGKISPQAAAYLIEQQVGRSKYGSKAYVKLNCSTCEENSLESIGQFLEEKRTEKELLTIEANRKLLGLEPLEDYKQKVLYSVQDNRFKLGYDWSIVNYQVPSKEAAKVMMESFVVADAE